MLLIRNIRSQDLNAITPNFQELPCKICKTHCTVYQTIARKLENVGVKSQDHLLFFYLRPHAGKGKDGAATASWRLDLEPTRSRKTFLSSGYPGM